MSAGLPFQVKYWSRAAAAHAQALLLLHMLKGFLYTRCPLDSKHLGNACSGRCLGALLNAGSLFCYISRWCHLCGACRADLPALPALVQPAQQLFQAKYKAEEHLGVLTGVPNAD